MKEGNADSCKIAAVLMDRGDRAVPEQRLVRLHRTTKLARSNADGKQVLHPRHSWSHPGHPLRFLALGP